MRRRSLSPAQLRFFKISPCNLHNSNNPTAQQLLQQSLLQTSPNLSFQTSQSFNLDLCKIPKNSHGNYESTLRNFGVLMNKNLGYETSQHQVQKFGGRAKNVREIMILMDKERFMKENRLDTKIREISDIRVELGAQGVYAGFTFNFTLHSFQLESTQNEQPSRLPLQYLRLLTAHVSSSLLIEYISGSIKSEGNQLVVDYDRIQTRVRTLKNTEEQYQRQDFEFQKYGYKLVLRVPMLVIECGELGYVEKMMMGNADMLRVVEENFKDVGWVLSKYLDKKGVEGIIKEREEREREKQRLIQEEKKERKSGESTKNDPPVNI